MSPTLKHGPSAPSSNAHGANHSSCQPGRIPFRQSVTVDCGLPPCQNTAAEPSPPSLNCAPLAAAHQRLAKTPQPTSPNAANYNQAQPARASNLETSDAANSNSSKRQRFTLVKDSGGSGSAKRLENLFDLDQRMARAFKERASTKRQLRNLIVLDQTLAHAFKTKEMRAVRSSENRCVNFAHRPEQQAGSLPQADMKTSQAPIWIPSVLV